jgi:hypothetical protein
MAFELFSAWKLGIVTCLLEFPTARFDVLEISCVYIAAIIPYSTLSVNVGELLRYLLLLLDFETPDSLSLSAKSNGGDGLLTLDPELYYRNKSCLTYTL